MSVEENKLIAHRFFEEVWNQGNLDVFDELITSDIVIHARVNYYYFPNYSKRGNKK